MRKVAAIVVASLLAVSPIVAEAQTVQQTMGPPDNFGFNTPGFYIASGLALVGLTIGIIALVDENHHHHHHQQPISP